MTAMDVPVEFRRGCLQSDNDKYVASAVYLINLICRQFELESLAGIDMLDIGCGTKFTQALLDHDLPIGRYTGVDINAELIDFLRDNVVDERFSYHYMNTHNDMYNPEGEPLTATTRLPVGHEQFDIICIFSVFTHLAPHDYHNMLHVLRPYIKDDGKLLFSAFINEEAEGGHGLIARTHRELGTQGKPPDDNVEAPDFLDAGKTPLVFAIYSRAHALELIDNTGWKIESLNPPEEHIQHYFICSPA